MKKLILLFLLLPFLVIAQVSTGQEQEFDTGIKNNSTQTVITPSYLVTQGIDGTYGKALVSSIVVPSTTAGTFTRVNFTGDVSVVNSVNYYATSTTSKGSASSVAQTVTPDDNQKLYFAQDYISILQPSLIIYPPGSYSGQFAVQVANNSVQQKFYIEIYKTNSLGVPIASGVSGASVGSLGVTLITTLESGLVSLTGSVLTSITFTGTLTGSLTVNANERIRYHIAAEKVGTAGAGISMQIFSGTNYNSYYDVPVPVTTDGVTNKSTVTGDSGTEALNTLNTLKANDANVLHTTGDESATGQKSFTASGSRSVIISPNSGNSALTVIGSSGAVGVQSNVISGAAGFSAVQQSGASGGGYYRGVNSSGVTIYDVDFSGAITGSQFKRTGGLSSQFLKADGSIDANVYATDINVLHTSGNEGFTGIKNSTNTGSGSQLSGFSLINNSATSSVFNLSNNANNSGFIISNTSTGTGQTINSSSSGTGLQVVSSGTGQGVRSAISGSNTSPAFSAGVSGSATGLLYEGRNSSNVIVYSVSNAGVISGNSFVKTGGLATEYLKADGSVSTLTNPVTGTGSSNFVPVFTSSSTIGNSNILNDASSVRLRKGTVILGDDTVSSNYFVSVETSMSNPANFQGSLQGVGAADISMQTSGGNVLIGTAVSTGKKLEVNGSIARVGGLPTQILMADGSTTTVLSGSATLNFPSTPGQTSSELTITVTGAADGDCVSLGVGNSAAVANGAYSCRVSAANTVTVKFNNYGLLAIDPPSGTFKVKIFK